MSGTALAGFILAAFSTLLAPLPFLTVLSWVTAPVALGLLVPGLIATGKTGNRGGRGLAIAGLVLVVLVICVAIANIGMMV